MGTHSVSGFALFLLFIVFFVIGPTLLGSWWAGFRLKDINRQNPLHILTLAAFIFVGVIVAAVLVQSHVLSGTYTF